MTSWMLALLGLTLCLTQVALAERSFTVDYKNNTFLKDGEPFRYVSGSVHYFRVPKQYWRDRLHKLRMAGLNAVQTYVEWSGHEPEPGKYNFEGDYDLKTFLKTAQDVGLLVILRPGPYICAERDNGGLPYWLLRQNPDMRYRTSDKTYLSAVDKWLSVLLPLVKPFLYNNGGPVITVQVENEYGQYGACDHAYMQHLVDTFTSHLGKNVTLFRTDGPNEIAYKCDSVNNTLVTADFGPGVNVNKTLQLVRDAQGPGPLVVTEYYPGWLDNWGKPHFHANHTAVLDTFEEILKHNASVNLYMFHGGTNFGFTSGSDPPPQPTSYDYGAPLSEAGDPTELYFKIRNITGKYLPLPGGRLPGKSRKLRLGRVLMSCGPSLDDIMSYFRRKGTLKTATSKYPITFEELGQDGGYVVYTTTVGFQPNSPALLSVPVKNRGYVYTNFTKAVLNSDQFFFSVPAVVEKGETLKIIVENTGRINVGILNHDPKGIVGNVTLDGKVLTNWTMEAVPIARNGESTELFDMLQEVDLRDEPDCKPPRAYLGEFRLRWHEEPLDTFLDPTGWTKGVAFLNGFNLGRYWPVVGPQVTLYVPGTLIRHRWRKNLVVLLEMEGADRSYRKRVKFVSVPNVNGTTPVE